MPPTAAPRLYPLAPLVALHPYRDEWSPTVIVAELLDVTYRAAWRWVHEGALDDRRADRAACTLGLHPCLIWPTEWWANATPEPEGND